MGLRLVVVLSMLLIGSVTFAETADGGNDVYNFYFQKDQGAKGEAEEKPDVQVTTKDGKVTEVVSKDADEEEEGEEEGDADDTEDNEPQEKHSSRTKISDLNLEPPQQRWTAKFGLGVSPAFSKGMLIGARYRINRYVDLTGDLIGATSEGTSLLDDAEVAFGSTLTPIHISIFGWDAIWISFISGVYSGKRKSNPVFEQNSMERTAGFYYGPSIRFNISSRLAVELFNRRDRNLGSDRSVSGIVIDFKY